jgi:2-oxoglutarate dehydrogenase E2 component (dihydrolipoamide succinyltransferase)
MSFTGHEHTSARRANLARMPDADTTPVPPWRVRGARTKAGAGFLSPAVRRRLVETGMQPDDVVGSGAGARVTLADVAAAHRRAATTDVVEPFTAIRRTTALHVTQSLRTIPHGHVATLCDYSRVEPVRRAQGLTYLPFVARAVIDGLHDFPRCNATSGDAGFVVHRAVHLGIAVDLAFEGLIVPVVPAAEGMRLSALATAFADVAARARSRQLRPDEVVGGTFTITNPGPYGTWMSMPIINPPQVAILATDGVRRRVVADETLDGADALTIRPLGMLSLSFDRRLIDESYAAAFVRHVADVIASRDWSTEL